MRLVAELLLGRAVPAGLRIGRIELARRLLCQGRRALQQDQGYDHACHARDGLSTACPHDWVISFTGHMGSRAITRHPPPPARMSGAESERNAGRSAPEIDPRQSNTTGLAGSSRHTVLREVRLAETDSTEAATRLALKYDRPVPRYTSYPTAPHFNTGIGATDLARWLAASDPRQPISLYIHVPYCRQMCWYCGCHTKIVARY